MRQGYVSKVVGTAIGALALFALTTTFARGEPPAKAKAPLKPRVTTAAAFDVSPPLAELARQQHFRKGPFAPAPGGVIEIRPEPGPVQMDRGWSGDGALQSPGMLRRLRAAAIPSPMTSFDGLNNTDNFNIFGGRVNPPDTNGDVGKHHVVEIINLVYGVYDKAGNLLLGPVDTGSLWAGFAIPDCTDPSGDPIVLYDQFTNRWFLTQFTTRGLNDPTMPIYDCVAVSMTGDPTGSYYRYAFETQPDLIDGGWFFPDYPKYGLWRDNLLLTTRDFGWINRYGISVYAIEKNKMIGGQPDARAVQFFLEIPPDGDVDLNLVGDGLLPPDVDGNKQPPPQAKIPIVGTQDDDASYGATFDAVNIWELSIKWKANPEASLELATQLPTAPFDSIFPCAGNSRDCLPQPGVAVPQYLDVLSYRQRPIWRLAYRNFNDHEALVTNQSVEARPGIAGTRWYEIRRANPDGSNVNPAGGSDYSIYQQGTYSPDDVHRWMGSIAQDRDGNMLLGYSVVNGVDVYPGIRYTGRMAGDPLGQMTLGEGTIIDGTGVQTTTNSRWGDYTSMNVDPSDDCTFWYFNEYYTAESQTTSAAGWLTRIASIKIPGCKPGNN
jgi:hypothetical protein